MRRSQIRKVNLRRRLVSKTSEGSPLVTWDNPIELEAIIWQASGAVQAAQYGEKLSYIKNMEYQGDEAIKENDGICIYVEGTEKPDYRVSSINPDVSPKLYVLEKING